MIIISWQEELKKLMESGCSDSDVEDFVDEHPEVNGKEIWDYVYEYDAPDACKGCGYIQCSGMFPCNRCSRKVEVKDYYIHR